MTLGFWITSEYLIELIYQRGQFSASDTHHVALLANCYAVQFPLLVAATAATSLLSARALNRVFIPINAALLVCNVLLTVALMNLYGAAGIAASSSLTYLVSCVLLLAALIRREVIDYDRHTIRRFLTPFVILIGVGLLVFPGTFRLTRNANLLQYAEAGLLLCAFAFLAVASNRSFLRRAVTSWRRS